MPSKFLVKAMFFYFCTWLCTSLITSVHAFADHGRESRYLPKREDSDSQAFKKQLLKLYPTEFATLPLDHSKPDGMTFKNRFWVNDTFYQTGGPVFLFDHGEEDAASGIRYLNNTWFTEMLDSFGGIGIVWEHRYYGKSSPFDISAKTSACDFAWLTVEQALADIPSFASNFSRPRFPEVDLTPKSTPWVMIGGSYPGTRAALARAIYPDTIYAAWAAGAPMRVQMDASAYHDIVYKGMNAYGLGNCTTDIHAAILRMDELLDDPTSAATLKTSFAGPGTVNKPNDEFAVMLKHRLEINWQRLDMEPELQKFCNYISTDPATNHTSPKEGWAVSKGADFTIERWASFYQQSNRTKFDEPMHSESATMAWLWQICTQLGLFQPANVGPQQIISKYLSLEASHKFCYEAFPDGLASGLMPDCPQVNETNAELFGWSALPSNTYWSCGEFDPWRFLTPLNREAEGPDYTITQAIPACNVRTEDGTVFGYVMNGSAHVLDVNVDACKMKLEEDENCKWAAHSRKLFQVALRKWLKCFEPTD